MPRDTHFPPIHSQSFHFGLSRDEKEFAGKREVCFSGESIASGLSEGIDGGAVPLGPGIDVFEDGQTG